jgi:hypothetical protein
MPEEAENLVETLTHMSESDVLDFKEAQYKFVQATDIEKSELVKDILAFANAWKTSDAHILIGAKPKSGGGADVCGISSQIDDASLQQLVNSKTNVPVSFAYVPFTFEGKQVAVIIVRRDQRRPIFLQKPFGKLKGDTVYLRRGSSTEEANPAEVARMGAHAAVAAHEPLLQLTWTDGDTPDQTATSVTSTVLRERTPEMVELLAGVLDATEYVRRLNVISAPEPDAAEVIKHEKTTALLSKLTFTIRNVGRVLAEDVRVSITFPLLDGFVVLGELPAPPRSYFDMLVESRPLAFTRNHDVNWLTVTRGRDGIRLVARFVKIQPSAAVRSEPFVSVRSPAFMT